MRIKTEPAEIFAEYAAGEGYNSRMELYETVRRNEDFYIGEQWKGVVAPDLEKPVLNFLHRVVTYFTAMIVSDDIAISFRPFSGSTEDQKAADLLAQEVEQVMERTKARAKNRDILRDMAVDGDGCAHFWFDTEAQTGQTAQGEICMDVIENTKMIFADPYKADVQSQPYLLLVRRSKLETIRERARRNGIGNADEIQPDSGGLHTGDENPEEWELVTSVVKYWKERGTVHYTEVTHDAVIQKKTDTGCRLYPFAWANWERVKNSYHGRAAITGLIPNQIFVNKMWAMAMEQVKKNAFPKVIYNKNALGGQKWTNRIGEAIGVNGNPNEAIASGWRAPDMSAQVMEMVDRTISLTKEFMGASDAALGNVRPENTSAIIAVQKASSAPLELQRMAFYQFVEDYVRIIVDMMRAYYGIRLVRQGGQDATGPVAFDFSSEGIDAMQLMVDVGESSYWSELMQIQTMDNLFEKKIIGDAVTYVENIPDKYIPGKKKLLEELKRREEAAKGGEMPQMPGSGSGEPFGGPALAGISVPQPTM